MKIFIVTFGSLGDVLPYVALGKGLRARGHEATLCTNCTFRSLVEDHGLAYAYMNDGFTRLARSPAGRRVIESLTNLWGTIKGVSTLARQVGPIQRETLADAWRAATDADPDVIIFYAKAIWATDFAEALDVPAIAAPLFPQFLPTAQFPSLGFPDLGGWNPYNRTTYRIVDMLSRFMVGKYVREWRQASGTRRSRGNLLETPDGAPRPFLHAYSPLILPEPDDWPAKAVATGYWILNESPASPPSRELEAFLEAGDPPVYVGFGSMARSDPRRSTEVVLEAIDRAGVRGIIATGWGGLAADELPESTLKIEAAPHDWLFPRVAAVVHHGGAGTTASGLRAGRPSVICPFFGDQVFWGRRVYELGLGCAPIPQKRLTARNLSEAIREVLDSSTVRENARAIGARLRQEDGVARAVALIEEHAGTGGRVSPSSSDPIPRQRRLVGRDRHLAVHEHAQDDQRDTGHVEGNGNLSQNNHADEDRRGREDRDE